MGTQNGLDPASVINLDNVQTMDGHDLGRQIGFPTREQEAHLAWAVSIAFDLRAD